MKAYLIGDTEDSLKAKAFLASGFCVELLRAFASVANGQDIGKGESILVEIDDEFRRGYCESDRRCVTTFESLEIFGVIGILYQLEEEPETVIIDAA